MLYSLQFPATCFILKILEYYWFNNVELMVKNLFKYIYVDLLIEVGVLCNIYKKD